MESERTYLTMEIGGELFAVEVGRTREILDSVITTRLPNMPDYMTGVINVRGSAIPLIDMRLKLGISAPEKAIQTTIIVLEIPFPGGVNLIGSIVDEVREVMDVSPENVEPPPAVGGGMMTNFLSGMYQHGDRFIMILETEKLFTRDEQVWMDAMESVPFESREAASVMSTPEDEPVADTETGTDEELKADEPETGVEAKAPLGEAVSPSDETQELIPSPRKKMRKPRRRPRDFDIQIEIKIAHKMEEAGMTIEELAARIDMDRRTLKRLISKNNPNTTIATLQRIAKGIGCHWKELVE